MKADLNFIRAQFPAFSEPSLRGWAFFENAGGSYPCQQVIDRLTHFYTAHKVQPYYPYPASERAGKQMDETYARMAAYLNIQPEEIHFGPSTTQNVYVLARAMRPMWEAGDQIIVSCQDHEANAGAWRRLADTGIVVTEWHVDPETGMLDAEKLKELFTDRTKMVAFPHCSNVIGYVNPVTEISAMARAHGAVTVVDAVGWVPHEIPDLKALGADIYMFSSYKTYGPHLGVMYVDKALMAKLENQSHFFKDGIPRSMLTPAGPDHAQIAALGGVLEYFDAVHDHHFGREEDPPSRAKALNKLFRAHESDLLKPLMAFIAGRDDLRLAGPGMSDARAPIVSILPLKKSVKKVYDRLTGHQLMLGYGNFYAHRPLMDMGIGVDPGVIRMSFVHYTSDEEIQQLIDGLTHSL